MYAKIILKGYLIIRCTLYRYKRFVLCDLLCRDVPRITSGDFFRPDVKHTSLHTVYFIKDIKTTDRLKWKAGQKIKTLAR